VAGIVGSSGAGLKVIVVERLLAVLRTLLASPFLEDRAPNSSGMARVAEAVDAARLAANRVPARGGGSHGHDDGAGPKPSTTKHGRRLMCQPVRSVRRGAQ
jgi:hypothetical protein